jgi:uncharacterized protein YkwD
LSRLRGHTPDVSADMTAADPWAHTAPLAEDPYERNPGAGEHTTGGSGYIQGRYEPEPTAYAPAADYGPAYGPYRDQTYLYPDPPDEIVPRQRRMSPLAVAGMVAAVLISIGLVFALLSPAFSGGGSKKDTASNLPGLPAPQPSGGGASAAPPAPTDAPSVPTDSTEPSASPSLSAPADQGGRNAGAENAAVSLINQVRQRSGCDPVSSDDRLVTAARQHSADMANGNFLNHQGSDGSSPNDRMQAAGFTAPLSEDLARGFNSARDVVRAWTRSRADRANITDCDAQVVGVGVAVGADGTPYWTADFGGSP